MAANEGTVFARLGPAAGSCAPSLTVIAVRPDDRIERYADVATLVATDLARVRSATRRNTLWDVGVDGALWYRYAAGNIHELRQVVGDVAGYRIEIFNVILKAMTQKASLTPFAA